ncbi:MAG: M17 family peptidase N-terminal domain-containing protein, partial [Planctomycetaceae bacterium]
MRLNAPAVGNLSVFRLDVGELQLMSSIETCAISDVAADWLVLCVATTDSQGPTFDALDAALDGQLNALLAAGDLETKVGKLLPLYQLPGITAQRLLLVGCGKPAQCDQAALRKALLTAARLMSGKPDQCVVAILESRNDDLLSAEAQAEILVSSLLIGCVGQDLYHSKPKRFEFASVALHVSGDVADTVTAAMGRGGILGESVNLTREMVNRPPQEIYPESFAERARTVAEAAGLECDIFDQERLESERMGALLAVAQGSHRPPRMVVLEHHGGNAHDPPLALCGKGVTFDSGGLSLKTNEGMLTMKSDMAGAATVLGAMSAIGKLQLPVNVIGLMGLVENMPGGGAYKLGDVLTSRNGVTIEVLNTDAEGRLVLADVLSYAVDRGADRVIGLATLTGACVVAR